MLNIISVKKKPKNFYNRLGFIIKGSIIEINVIELSLIT